MPRSTTARRKKTALSHIVQGNDTIRAVCVLLRRSRTDALGQPREFTVEDVQRCIDWVARAQRYYDNAHTVLVYLRDSMQKEQQS